MVAIPGFELSTECSRAALPDSVSREDAVHALSHTALAVAAVATGHPELLGRAMEDLGCWTRAADAYRAVVGFAPRTASAQQAQLRLDVVAGQQGRDPAAGAAAPAHCSW